MGPILLLLVVGLVLLVAVLLIAALIQERRRVPERMGELVVPVNLTDNNNAVIVAEGRGHIVFVNEKARLWFGMNGGEPNLEVLAEQTHPTDSFIELFGKEGQASFNLGPRRVEATSHYIPRPDTPQLVVVLRELVGPTRAKPDHDPGRAMQVIGQIAEAISSGLTLEETLNTILKAVGEAVAYDAGEITLWEPDGQVLRPVGRNDVAQSRYYTHFDETDGVYHLDDSFSGWLARYRQPLLIANVQMRPDVRPKLADYPFASYVGVPLIISDRLIGTLELGSLQFGAFDHEDMALLQAAAGQAAIAIDNARLSQSQAERAAELAGLQQIAQAVSSLTNTREIYGQLSTRIAELINAEMCGILLYDPDQHALIAQTPFHNVSDTITSLYRIPLSENSAAARLWQSREWWYTNNVQGDDLVRSLSLLGLAEALGVRTTALAPMIVGNRRIGVVQVSNKRDRAGFIEDDLRLLAAYASQTAIVVENARLHGLEQNRADEVGNLQQISRAISILRDPIGAREQITARIAQLMNVQICGLLLFDPDRNMLVAQTPFFGVVEELVVYYEIPLPPGSPLYALYTEADSWFVNDLSADALARNSGLDKLAELLDMRQALFVPLIADGERLGVIQVANKISRQPFHDGDARTLVVLAAQAAMIINNARLYRDMSTHATEAEGLRNIATLVNSEEPLEAIIKQALPQIAMLLSSKVAMLALLDETIGKLNLLPEHTYGLPTLVDPFSLDVYAPGMQYSTAIAKRSFLSNDVLNDERSLPVYRAFSERFHLKSVLQVPLLVHERSLGELTVANRQDGEYTSSDNRLLQAVALQIAALIERTRLYQSTDADLRARIDELDALSRVSNELNVTVQLERILDVIRQEAQRTTNAKGTSVVVLKDASEWLKPDQPEIDQRVGDIQERPLSLWSIERQAILEGQPILVNDYQPSASESSPKGVRSALVVPIQYGGQVAGVLHLYTDTPEAFSSRSVDFAKALGNQTAIAIGNAMRYRQQLERNELLRQRADQLSQIFELGRMIRTNISVVDVLEAVANSIVDAVGFKVVIINTADKDAPTYRPTAQAGVPLAAFRELQGQPLTIPQVRGLLVEKYRISASYFLPGEESDRWFSPDVPVMMVEGLTKAPITSAWDPKDALITPLYDSKNELIGFISVDDPRDHKRPARTTIEALEIFANQAAFAIENYQLLQAFQEEAEAARRERDRLAQLHQVASEIQRATDIPSRLQVVVDGIRSAGWGRVHITLRNENLEPRELIAAGYSAEELAKLKGVLLPGIVWRQRLADPDFRRYRVGQAYYLRFSDQWVTESKLLAGAPASGGIAPETNPGGATTWHPLDTVYLPLYGLDQSRLIGIITMDSPLDGKPPTETSIRPIELFAGQAASAIENTRLYQETISRAQQEQRLNTLMEAVASTLNTDDILAAIARALHQLLPYTRLSVGLADELGRTLERLTVELDLRGETVNITPGDSISVEGTATGRAYRELSGRVYHAAPSEGSRTADYPDLAAWRADGERTSLVVPMIAGGRAAGVLHLGSELVEAFGFDELLPLVQRMANLTAVAIENARLFQQTIDRERFTAALGRVGQSLSGISDLSNFLQTVCNEVAELLELAGATIWIRENEALTSVAGSGSGQQLNGKRLSIQDAKNSISVAFREARPIIVNDFPNQNQYQNLIVAQALMNIPIIREQQVIGVLALISDKPHQSFSSNDVERAGAFAAQVGVGLETERLYQQTLGLTAFNEAIVQSIQQGIVVLDKDGRIRTINGYLKQHYSWADDAIGQDLFAYRPHYEPLRGRVTAALRGEQPEPLTNWRDVSTTGGMVVRNFYIYPLLQANQVNGAVVLIEDITERAELEADRQARQRELAALTEASGKLATSLEPETVAQLVLDQVGQVLPYDNATLWIRQGEKLIVRAAHGYLDAEALAGVEVEIADSALFREIASRGQVLNIPDVGKDARFPNSSERPTRSWLGIALSIKDNLLGLLVLEKIEPNFYKSAQEQIGLAFANQAAVSLENARLFQQRDRAAQENTQLYQEARRRATELNQQAQRMALLNRVASSLAQSLDIENVFEVTLSELIEMLGMDRGSAILLEPEQQRGQLVIEYPRASEPPHNVYIRLVNNPLYDELQQTKRPVAIYEVATDPRMIALREFLQRRNVLSTLFIPLVVGGQLIGTLNIDATQEYHLFTADQIELAQTIASQAAVAAQNAKLFEQSVQRTHELGILFESTQATTSTLDLDEVIRNAVRQMIPALQVDVCQISLFDDVENRLEIRVDIRAGQDSGALIPAGQVFLPLNDYPARSQAIAGRQLLTLYADDSVIDVAESTLLTERGMFGRMISPLVVRDQTIGLVVAEIAETGRRFDPAQTRLARALTGQTAVAIDNARLQTETANKLNELFVLNELSVALASSIELEQIYRVIRTQWPTLVDAEIMLLAAYDSGSGSVTYPVAIRRGAGLNIRAHSLGDDEISYVIKHKTPLLLAGDDVEEVVRIFGISRYFAAARSYLAVPLQTGDEIVGAMALVDENSARAFGLDDQRVLTTIGAQVAVSIQNSRLFERNRRTNLELEQRVQERTEELRRERDRLNTLVRITASLTASLDIEQVLNRALEMIAGAIGAEMGVILGVDSVSENLMYRATYGIEGITQPDRMVTFTQNEGLAGWIVQTQQSIIVPDVQQDPRWLRRTELDDEPRSAIASLLEANEDILGVIMLYHRQPNCFNEDHLRLVSASAGQIATAMNNADLYGLIREQAERLGLMVRREQVEATKNLAIVESIGDGVMVTDQSGEIIQFNSAAERVLAMTRRDVIGKHINDLGGLYAASGGDAWMNTLQGWMDDPTKHHAGDVFQERLVLDNNHVVSVVLSPVGMGDQFLGTVSIFRDITRETEIDRMKSDFVANVSHELRTPMTSIKGYADLLLMGGAGQISEQQRGFLSIVKTNADRLSALVNDLLDISRIDKGTVKLTMELLNVADVIETGLAHVNGRMTNENKDINITSDIAPNLPLVSADFDKLVQILNNLLDNAFNYTHPGGSITISAHTDGDSVVFSVKDTGVGIAPENRDRVFERFFRDESNELVLATSGTGLGLAIVRDYVKMHRGDIWFESEVPHDGQEGGTTFYVRLPSVMNEVAPQSAA